MSVTAAPFPSNITMMDYINTTTYSTSPTQVNTTGPAFNNVTMMLTLSTIFMNTSESTSNVTATTQKPRKISLKCIPGQLAKRYKPATLELLMKRTGLKVCTSNQAAVDRSELISSHQEYKASAGILVYKYYVLLPLAVVSNGLLLLTVGRYVFGPRRNHLATCNLILFISECAASNSNTHLVLLSISILIRTLVTCLQRMKTCKSNGH